jgi:hypothetical protein
MTLSPAHFARAPARARKREHARKENGSERLMVGGAGLDTRAGKQDCDERGSQCPCRF